MDMLQYQLTDDEIETITASFWAKYVGKGLNSSEVLELHRSEYWGNICRAQVAKVFSVLDRSVKDG